MAARPDAAIHLRALSGSGTMCDRRVPPARVVAELEDATCKVCIRRTTQG